MLVSTTRTLSALATRAIFYASLFLIVAIVHIAITTALRTSGWLISLANAAPARANCCA
jgi:hypothetical protein